MRNSRTFGSNIGPLLLVFLFLAAVVAIHIGVWFGTEIYYLLSDHGVLIASCLLIYVVSYHFFNDRWPWN
jgi:hypothetical protein